MLALPADLHRYSFPIRPPRQRRLLPLPSSAGRVEIGVLCLGVRVFHVAAVRRFVYARLWSECAAGDGCKFITSPCSSWDLADRW